MKTIKTTQHCTSEECTYTQSHTAEWCGNDQPRRCSCAFCYSEDDGYTNQLLEFLAQNDNGMLDEEAGDETLWVGIGASDAEDDARRAEGVVGTLAVTLEDTNRNVTSRYRLVLVKIADES